MDRVVKKLATALLGICLSALIGITFTQLSTQTHELIHVLVSRVLGAESGVSSLFLYTGSTSYEFSGEVPYWYDVVVAMSPPIVIFIIALGIWLFFGENSIIRVLAIIMMMYSVLPSSFPLLPGSDFSFAISKGANPVFVWLIWFFMNGVFYWLLAEEVMDRKLFGKIFK